jgi:beta-RFAP synthase
VVVKTSARLHLGFLDLNGSLGRLFGSLGVGLDSPQTVIEVSKGHALKVEPESNKHVLKVVENYIKLLKIETNVQVKITQIMPQHAGLGSGTQTALAIGAGMNELFGLGLSVAQISAIAGRGKRSGIGIGTFEHGGIVLDGGSRLDDKTTTPPIIARHDFPEDWRILLIMDDASQGTFGEQEQKAFDKLPKANLSTTKDLSYIVLMQALPALIERDYEQFSRAVYALQMATGTYFAPAQNGLFASEKVGNVLNFCYQNHFLCAGQSSWGPTGFVVLESQESALAMQLQLQKQFGQTGLRFEITRGKNTGATIQSFIN